MYVSLKNKLVQFIHVPSTFIPFFSPSEVDFIVTNYFKGAFNSKTLRLEKIEHAGKNSAVLSFSEVDFFSLLTSNILYNKKEIKEENEEIANKILNFQNMKVQDTNVIENLFFANNLAVSVLIEDVNKKKLIVKRGRELAVGADLVSVSVTGGVDFEDIYNSNPIFSAVKREVEEELGLNINDENITLEGIFIGENKLQPIALCSVKLTELAEDLNIHGADTKFEIEKFMWLEENEIDSLINAPMTEASRFHLNLSKNY